MLHAPFKIAVFRCKISPMGMYGLSFHKGLFQPTLTERIVCLPRDLEPAVLCFQNLDRLSMPEFGYGSAIQ
jgi:hypothetical protein